MHHRPGLLCFFFATGSAILVLLLFSVQQARSRQAYKRRWLSGLSIGLLIAITGFLLVKLQMASEDHPFNPETSEFIAEVVGEPSPTERTVKVLLQIQSAIADSSFEEKVRIMAFFEKDSSSLALQFGDRLLFNGRLQPIKGPQNPGEFDYRAYLARNGIRRSVFVAAGRWEHLGKSDGNFLKSSAAQLRYFLLKSLRENCLHGKDYNVAAAILLGYDNLMEKETEQDFVTAGAMHILCVSGLHVGVIYLVMNLLLGFLNRNRFQRILNAILLLLFVWAYALLTGLAPSVQRASVMLSVFIVGNAIGRRTNAYNSLAASAFLLLLFDPLLIFDVGFRLSYAAVTGILVFYRPVYKLLYLKNRIADKTWSLMVLSFSAQLGTFPLAAHYFHFFPTYFLLTNLLVMPLSFLIITTGMAFMAVSWLPLLPKLLGAVLSGLLFLLNHSVALVRYLPFHGTGDLFFPWIKMLLVYALIVLIFLWLSQKNIRLLLPVLTVSLGLLLFQTIRKYNVLKQKRIVVYSIRGSSAYDFVSGNEHLLLLDSALMANTGKLEYFLANSRLKWGLRQRQALLGENGLNGPNGFFADSEFAAFDGFKMAFVDGSQNYFPGDFDKLRIDAIFVRGKRQLRPDQLKKCFRVEKLVLDGSVPGWKCKRIEQEGKAKGLQVYNVNKQGAFVLELP